MHTPETFNHSSVRMGSCFGGSKKTSSSSQPLVPKPSTINEKDKAILDLKRARDKLEKYQRKVCDGSLRPVQGPVFHHCPR